MKASEIAELVGGRLEGPDGDVTAVAPLDRAGPSDLSFLAHIRYATYLPAARAGAMLVAEDLAARVPDERSRIIVEDVHRALGQVLERLHPEPAPAPGIHPTAVIDERARLGERVTIGPQVVIGADARVGDRARIGAHSVIGAGAELGPDVRVHPHVTVYPSVQIGARTILHSGVRLGVDGFGYAQADGEHRKIPQVGGCSVGADVEIGANSTVDRGSVGDTVIGDGVKIDNLVHIGHNVRIGAHSIIVAQVGISGSTILGERVTLAGQVGLPGHIEIGDGATIAARGVPFGDVPAGAVYSGVPARPHKEALRAQAALFRLPELLKRLRALERTGATDPDDSAGE